MDLELTLPRAGTLGCARSGLPRAGQSRWGRRLRHTQPTTAIAAQGTLTIAVARNSASCPR